MSNNTCYAWYQRENVYVQALLIFTEISCLWVRRTIEIFLRRGVRLEVLKVVYSYSGLINFINMRNDGSVFDKLTRGPTQSVTSAGCTRTVLHAIE